MRDAEGRPLRVAYEQKFRVGPADRTPLDPARWKIAAPAVGTRAALVVAFGEPMEHALASRVIEVWQSGGAEIDGEVTLGAEERSWSFVPAAPWRTGAHRLVIATTIEDLAGNNIGKVFDVDVLADRQRSVERPTVDVGFEINPPRERRDELRSNFSRSLLSRAGLRAAATRKSHLPHD
eukprot:gene19387-23758_t